VEADRCRCHKPTATGSPVHAGVSSPVPVALSGAWVT
jgi:hypothetical protein